MAHIWWDLWSSDGTPYGPVCLRSTSLESPYDYWGRYTQSKRNRP